MSINRVVVCGNLTRDGELRNTASGSSILTFGIAVNERMRNQSSGEWEDRPNYFDCVVFGSRAQGLQPYLTKGVKVVIEGKLRWSQWEKDGQRRSKVDIVVDGLDFASSRNSSGQASASQPSAAAYGANNAGYTANYGSSASTGATYSGSYGSYGASGSAQGTSVEASPSPSVVTPAVTPDSSVYDEDIPF
jgi:single-strand DNA-binding protein